MALEAVLMDGSHLMTGGKAVKDVAGYSFRDLLVGSEGTLGIVTEVTVSLIPPPKAKKTMVAYFKDVATAGQAVSEIVAAKIIPATLEILEQHHHQQYRGLRGHRPAPGYAGPSVGGGGRTPGRGRGRGGRDSTRCFGGWGPTPSASPRPTKKPRT